MAYAYGDALRQAQDAGLQAFKELYEGTLVPKGYMPSQDLMKSILASAPNMYRLYGPNLGDDWLKQYLPAEGSAITSGMRQAIQAAERASAEYRGVPPMGGGLASSYKLAGAPTLPATLGEAQHEQWELGQRGQWYDPVNKDFGAMLPSVKKALSDATAQTLVGANVAVPFEGMTFGNTAGQPKDAISLESIGLNISPGNPYSGQIMGFLNMGMLPSWELQQKARQAELQMQKQTTAKREKEAADAIPDQNDIQAEFAALAPYYDNAFDYYDDIVNNWNDVVNMVTLPKAQALLSFAENECHRIIGQPGALEKLKLKFSKAPEKRTDWIRKYIEKCRKDGVWK